MPSCVGEVAVSPMHAMLQDLHHLKRVRFICKYIKYRQANLES